MEIEISTPRAARAEFQRPRRGIVFQTFTSLIILACVFGVFSLGASSLDAFVDFFWISTSVGFVSALQMMFGGDLFPLLGGDKAALSLVTRVDVVGIRMAPWYMLAAATFVGAALFVLSVTDLAPRFRGLSKNSKVILYLFTLFGMILSAIKIMLLSALMLLICSRADDLQRKQRVLAKVYEAGEITTIEYRTQYAGHQIKIDMLYHCNGYWLPAGSSEYFRQLPVMIAADFEKFTEGPGALVRRLEVTCPTRSDLQDGGFL